MKFIVMECHLSYAVVLDEAGRFLKVANMHYKIGETVNEVYEMQIPDESVKQDRRISKKWIYSLASLAACLLLVFTAIFQMGQTTYASVYLSINPEVRIDVNRNDKVVALEGINPDGHDLIKNYQFKKKELDLVLDELVELAIEKGYLHQGGAITLTFDAENENWIIEKSDSVKNRLETHLGDDIAVNIKMKTKEESFDVTNENISVTIPVDDSNYGTTNKEINHSADDAVEETSPKNKQTTGDSNYSSTTDGTSDYDFNNSQSNYGSSYSGQSNYNE